MTGIKPWPGACGWSPFSASGLLGAIPEQWLLVIPFLTLTRKLSAALVACTWDAMGMCTKHLLCCRYCVRYLHVKSNAHFVTSKESVCYMGTGSETRGKKDLSEGLTPTGRK